jgi:hypothetical protein
VATPSQAAGARQRSVALAHANRVRSERAELKRALAKGQRSAAEVVSDPPFSVLNMPIRQVVLSQRGWGPKRAQRLLRSASVPEDKQVGSLTARQRKALRTLLEARAMDRARVHELSSL